MAAQHERIIETYRRLLEAWNRRDADGYAAVFADDGSVVGFDGSQMNGRAEIATTLRGIFADHPTAAYVAKLREVRVLSDGVALVRAVVGMIPPGQTELNPAVNAIQSLIVVTDRAEPMIALLHNTPAAFHGRPHLVEQLTAELADIARSGRIIGLADARYAPS